MFRSKKGLLSNLNHICLQHVSLGVHLSLRPEVQEGPITRAPPEEEEQTTACQLCQEEATLEVDANSNNASTLCLCCESHTHQLLKNGIQNEETNLEEVLDDHREEAGSPLEHALSTLSVSSSISSCSDYTLEETPVSFYCREFLSDGIPSPDSQPDIVPLEDSPVNANWAISEENQTNHKSEERCDISSYLQAAQLPFITPEEKTENIGHRNSSTNQHGVLLECPPCTSNKENVDSNCNSLEDHQEQQALHHSEQLDTNFNKVAKPMSTAETNAPSLPPKTAASLQALRDECVKTTLEDLFGGSSLPIALEQTELRRAEESKKNITSFHELAQRRKRGTAVPPPQWMSKDRSDWLITFSPDTELPPVNELTASVLYHYDKAHAPLPPLPLEMPNALELSHKGVTTFREMRFRNSLNKQGAQQGKGTCQPPKDEKPADKWSSEKLEQTEQQVDTSLGSQFVGAPHGGLVPQPRGHVLGHPVPPPRRKKCRQGLQPIAESHLGGSDVPVEGGVQQKAELPAAPGADPWSRGKADGGDRHSKEDRPCRCFPGGASGGPVWMAGGGGDCAHHLEQKKGLLVAVSASVDKIIAHFSTTRNIVQKAQLGDSRLSPEVGHLVLNTLCPALYALVGDGLKPFQKDVIAGRRRTSPWTVVEASAKPGPATRPLHALFCRICQLPQLSSSRKKFNAFIFGLLNAKLLDFWVSRLQENSGEHSTLYMQGGFLSLAAGSYQPLFEELLLIVQPLCILTFHLDLLFEYHHLQVNLRLLQPSAGNPPCQAPGPVATTGVKQHTRPSLQNSANGQCKQKGRKDAGDPVAKGRPEPETKVDSEPRRPALNQEPTSEQRSGYQAGGTLQYTFQQVLDWGGKLTQTLVGNEDCSPGPTKDPTRETCTKPTEERKGTGSDVKATTWWGQLSQASQVYRVPSRSSFPFATWSKLRPSAANNCPSAPTNHEAKKPEREYPVDKAPSESLCTKTDIQSVHQKRESEKEEISSCSSSDAPTNGVQGLRLQGSFAKGQNGNLESHEKVNSEPRLAESTQDETPLSVHGTPEFQDSSNQDSPLSQISPDFVTPEYQESFNQGTPGSQKSWYKGLLGFQDLVKKRNLDHELQDTLEKNSNGLTPPTSNPGALALAGQVLATRSGDADSPSSGRGVWLGHLFGAPCSTSRGSPTDGEAHPVRSRRPSSWLPPNMNVLGLVRKGVFVEKLSTYEETSNRPEDAEKQLRTVRAICDHASSAGTHLSFQKDEVLQILDTVDDDWIRCSRGGTTGLVPVAYTSLIL